MVYHDEMDTQSSGLALAGVYADLECGDARRTRIRAHLAQNDVARSIGVSRSAVASWEEGRRRPRGVTAIRYGAFLASLRGLLGDESKVQER